MAFRALFFLAVSVPAHAASDAQAPAVCPVGKFSVSHDAPVLEFVLPGSRRLLVCGFHQKETPFVPQSSGSILMSEFDIFEVAPKERALFWFRTVPWTT